MGSIAREIGHNLRIFSAECAATGRFQINSVDGDDREAKLEEFLQAIDEERQKIEAFKRELPLCVILVSDVIGMLKEEIEQCRSKVRRSPATVEEFMPLRRTIEEDDEVHEQDCDYKDKMSWMSSVQLWSDGCSNKDGEIKKIQKRNEQNNNKGFWKFAGVTVKEEKPAVGSPDISLLSPGTKNRCDSGDRFFSFPTTKAGGRTPNQPPPRKARRCWSPELHRRFVVALQQLGGVQVATPKQIRDLMKVEGPTNDEVKSHLQKYRLHTRRSQRSTLPATVKSKAPASQLSGGATISPSGSPQSSLQLTISAARAISLTTGDSYEEEEDGKSESFGCKFVLHVLKSFINASTHS